MKLTQKLFITSIVATVATAAIGCNPSDPEIPVPAFVTDGNVYLQNGFRGYSGTLNKIITETSAYESASTDLAADSFKVRPVRSLLRFDGIAEGIKRQTGAAPSCDANFEINQAILYLRQNKYWVVQGDQPLAIELRAIKADAYLFDLTANWIKAGSAGNWAIKGSDIESEVLDSITVQGIPNDSADWQPFVLKRSLVRRWICNPSTNKGLALKVRGEDDYVRANPLGYAHFTGAFAPDTQLDYRPMLYISTYREPVSGNGNGNASGRIASSQDKLEPMREFERRRPMLDGNN